MVAGGAGLQRAPIAKAIGRAKTKPDVAIPSELLPFLREQAISIEAFRFGRPDPWSAEVI